MHSGPDRLRRDPLAHLPALLALAMASPSLPAYAHTNANAQLVMLCSGSAIPAPGQRPLPGRDCDSVCHAGCSRDRRGAGRSGRQAVSGRAPASAPMRAVKAIFSASDSECTPSFDIRLARWISTVRGLMPRS